MNRILLLAPLLLLPAACVSADSSARAALESLEAGRESARQNELPEAVDYFTAALRSNPDLAEAYYERGVVNIRLRLMKDVEGESRTYEDRAFADFSNAVKKNPAFADAYFNRAMLRSSRAQFKPAAEDLLNAIRYKATDAEPHLALGQIYETKFDDRAVAAMEHYEKYVELGGTDVPTREKVKTWRQLKLQMAPTGAPTGKAPGPEDEAKARELHEEFKRLFAASKKAEALAALEKLVSQYGRTKYAQERAREFSALLGALKR